MKIVITGTTGGIGGAVKAAAIAAGHVVVEINRDDFDSPEFPESLKAGGIDALVFASGVCPVKQMTLTDDETALETFRVNALIFLRLMRRLVSGRLYSTSGMSVIAVSSVSAVEGWPGGVAYCASKGALSAMCRAMDAELKSKRISVKAIEPRYVKTAMFDRCAGRMGVDPALAVDPADLAGEILSSLEAFKPGGGD